MTWIDAVLDSRLTLIGILTVGAGFQIFAFIKGWVLTQWQVKILLESRADYKAMWESERDQKLLLLKQLDQLSVVGETQLKILKALRTTLPHLGVIDADGEVDDGVVEHSG